MKSYICFILVALIHHLHAQNWQQVTDFPGTERDDGTGFLIGDTAYFGTGITPWWSNEADFYGLDLTTDLWFTAASLLWNRVANMQMDLALGEKATYSVVIMAVHF